MAEKKWIQKAIKRPGRLRELAEREGVSVREIAMRHKNDKSSLGAAARLYLNVLSKLNARRRRLSEFVGKKK